MRPYQIVLGGMVLATYAASVMVPAHAKDHPHTIGNTFGITYGASLVSGSTGQQLMLVTLVKPEVVEYLRDLVGPYTPISPVTFVLP